MDFTSFLLPIILFLAIIYFLMIRPNAKQQKERKLMLASLRLKDKIITIGGIHGVITKVKDDTVIVRVSRDVEIEFVKNAIQAITNRDYKQSEPVEEKHDEEEYEVEEEHDEEEYQIEEDYDEEEYEVEDSDMENDEENDEE
jgi:preprotein translocase subunit YajC